VAENKEVPDSNIGVPPVRKYANYRTLHGNQTLVIETLRPVSVWFSDRHDIIVITTIDH
jgi:hypothetical protein